MAEVEYATTARLPVQAIWDYVQDMDNWAHHMTGYQRHEKKSDTQSVWTLKGDVGVLTRTLTFEVDITEWAGPERVEFELKGVNEPMNGSGRFRMEPFEDPSAQASPTARPGLPSRMLTAVLRFLHRLVHGRVERAAGADAGPGTGMARLSFVLQIQPGGPMAPMINAMMKPAMTVAAEDLANKIIADVEARHASTPASPHPD